MKKYSFFLIFFCIIVSFSSDYEPTPYRFPDLRDFPKVSFSGKNHVTNEGVVLGRYLFYDTILSKNQDMSCASCHKQENAFSDAPNSFTKGRNGKFTKRNTLPLFNLAWYPSFFWDGRAKSIEELIFHPVRDTNEMNLPWKMATKRIKKSAFYPPLFKAAFGKQTIDSVLIANAIGQFLRTLLSYQSKFDSVLVGKAIFSSDEFEGFTIINEMNQGDCLECHTTDADALGTIREFSNNGLDAVFEAKSYKDKGLGLVTNKVEDNGKFKIPSLRNLIFTAPYMHDGRFSTIEEVLDFYSEDVNFSANIDSRMASAKHQGVHLNAVQKRKIIAFLRTLTDYTFVKNPDFSDPHE